MTNINYDLLGAFHKQYYTKKVSKTEKEIKKKGISTFFLDQESLKKFPDKFNIELPKMKVYNQGDSARCWICSGLNFIGENVAKNLNVSPEKLTLSINYISFLDKLEKSNTLYEIILSKKKWNIKKEIEEGYIKKGLYEGGYFDYFVHLIDKYGFVPEKIMPETFDSQNSYTYVDLYGEKIKKDMCKLIALKRKKTSMSQLERIKEQMLQENYEFLSKCLGEVPLRFDYKYQTLEKEEKILENITPLEFKTKFLSMNLHNYIGVANLRMYNKNYNKLYRKKYAKNVYEQNEVTFLNLPIEKLKEYTIKQLQDGVPVYFYCDGYKRANRKEGILDDNLWNYKELGFTPLTKEEALSMWEIYNNHVMLITGVQIENGKSIRWKVLDSFGSKVHKNGYYIMSDSYFENYIFEIFIHKKYLSEEEKKMLKQKPIVFALYEPFN